MHTLFLVGGDSVRCDGHHDDVRSILGGVVGVDNDMMLNDNLALLDVRLD